MKRALVTVARAMVSNKVVGQATTSRAMVRATVT